MPLHPQPGCELLPVMDMAVEGDDDPPVAADHWLLFHRASPNRGAPYPKKEALPTMDPFSVRAAMR